MRSTEELRQLFDTELEDKLQTLEGKRKKVRTISIVQVAVFVLALLLFFYAGELPTPTLGYWGGGALIVLFIFILVRFAKLRKEYVAEFKNNVVTAIVSLINPEWNYVPQGHISPVDYMESKLFTTRYDRYKGDDLVTGAIDKTDFKMSELHTEYKTETTDSEGRRKTEWHTIFKGLFAHMDFNKEIRGETLVLPDTAERLFGRFGKKLQSMSGRGELVNLENPEFEKLFVVYGSDQNEARYILTPTMMEAMVHLAKQYGKNIFFSFRGTRVYFAISVKKDLFEPRIFKSGVNFNDIVEMSHYFSIIEMLIKEMNLNTRIWTKQ